jgi:hypothetical protein
MQLNEIKFYVTCSKPLVGSTRPIPFSVRTEVRNQITQLLKDGIIESRKSSFINPLTVVLREGKSPRIAFVLTQGV